MQATSEQLLTRLIEQGSDHAIILLDPNGTIVGWLAGAEKTFGYATAEVLNRNVAILFTPEDNAREVSAHELQVARTNGRAEDDRWLLRKDGGRFWASGISTALRDNGELVGFGKVLRDRTEWREQIETAQNRVRSLVETNDKLRTFIALLSHEIRNPLNVIQNAMAILAKSGAEGTGSIVELVKRQIKFMVRLVEDLQETSRAGVSKVTLRRERIALQTVLEQAAEAVRPHTERRNQTFHVILIRAPLTVDIDPARIHQAMTNLLENAVKYTPDGGTIWLKCTVEIDEAVVAVEDNGVGIDKDDLPGIFELFTQVNPSASSVQEGLGAGLGLGLSLVKELVTLHGGSVQVRSPGRNLGSQFIVRLPLAPPD